MNPLSVEPQPPETAAERSMAALVEQGREITRQVAEAEARGDINRVDYLLREKDWINRMRKELSHVGR